MKEIDHGEMVRTLQNGYRTKLPQFYLGRTGIGKSHSIKAFCSTKATELNKELVEWDSATLEKKKEVIENPDRYFVFLDIRLAQYDPVDLKGLPSLEGVYTIWRNNMWVEAMSKADGVILFDEINHAAPILQNAVYQILLDRQVSETPLSKGALVLGAGNVAEDKSSTFRLPKPIISRVFIYRLKVPMIQKWTEWAIANNIHQDVISYLQWKNSCLFLENDNDINVITPRGWEFISRAITDIADMDDIELFSAGVLGHGGAVEFTSFLKLTKRFDLDEIVKKPKDAELPEEISQRYALVAALVGRYKDDKKCFNSVTIISSRLPPEYGMLMTRMVKTTDPAHFKESIFKTKEGEALMERIGKYL